MTMNGLGKTERITSNDFARRALFSILCRVAVTFSFFLKAPSPAHGVVCAPSSHPFSNARSVNLDPTLPQIRLRQLNLLL